MFNLRHIHRRRQPEPVQPAPLQLHRDEPATAPRNCITRHESVSGAVVLLGHDRVGRVQVEVRIPDAESSAPELLGALLGWFMDLHTEQHAPAGTLSLAASKVPPTRAD